MTLTLHLSQEAERKLQELAATAGLSLEEYVQNLLENQLLGPNGQHPTKTWQEICAPLAEAFAESDLTDEEVKDLFTEARDEVRAEKRAKRNQENTSE